MASAGPELREDSNSVRLLLRESSPGIAVRRTASLPLANDRRSSTPRHVLQQQAGGADYWMPRLKGGTTERGDCFRHIETCFSSKRHHDLAEVLVGFHVLEGFADIVELEHTVDRQLQFARLHRSPDVLADFIKDLADLLDGAGA